MASITHLPDAELDAFLAANRQLKAPARRYSQDQVAHQKALLDLTPATRADLISEIFAEKQRRRALETQFRADSRTNFLA